MTVAFRCENCGTALLNRVNLDASSLASSFLMSRLTFQMYALNLYWDGRGCGICGAKVNLVGQPPREAFERKTLERQPEPSTESVENWLGHARRHFHADLAMMTANVKAKGAPLPSARYRFAHIALRHFVFGAQLMGAGPSALFALVHPSTAWNVLAALTALASDDTSGPPTWLERLFSRRKTADLPPVEAFSISGGSGVLVTIEPPERIGEAYFVGLVTDVDLSGGGGESSLPGRGPLFFTLEKAESPQRPDRTMVCQWLFDGKRTKYGMGPLPNAHDFLDCLDRVYLANIWKEDPLKGLRRLS